MRRSIAFVLAALAVVLALTHYDPGASERIAITPTGPAQFLPSTAGYLGDDGNYAAILPPAGYWADTVAVAFFVEQSVVKKICGNDDAIACVTRREGTPIIVLPNTCPLQIAREEAYAALACHELGHLNGWSHE